MGMHQEIVAQHSLSSFYKTDNYAIVDVDGFPFKIERGEITIACFSSNYVAYNWFMRHNLHKDTCKVMIFTDDILRLLADAQEAYINTIQKNYDKALEIMPTSELEPRILDKEREEHFAGTSYYRNALENIMTECKKVLAYVDEFIKNEKGCTLYYDCSE